MCYGINALTSVVILLAGIRPFSGFYIQPEPIIFTLEPATQLACEGCSAEFTCEVPTQATAADLPPPSLGWTVNGTTISEAFDQSEFTITSQSGPSSIRSTLRIVVARPDHAGMYRCVATDGADTSLCEIHPCVPTMTISTEARLTILSGASGSVAVTITDCSSVLLPCGVEGHSLDVTWSKDGMELLEDSGLTPLPSGGLLVAGSSNTSDVTGLYQCTVVFPSGQNVSVALYNVQHIEEMSSVSPHIEVVASLPVAIESRPFEFICSTRNVCPGELSWEKDGVPVGVGSGMELALSGRALSFGSLEVGASGNYCCLLPAGGGIGQDLKSCAQLSVVGKPILGSVDTGSTVLLNRTAENAEINLDCNTTTGNSLQTIAWFWNGNVLDESLSENGTRPLKRSASDPMALFGIYQCFVSNPAGSAAILVRVLPLGLSNPPSRPTIEELPIANTFTNPRRVTLRFTWQPPYYTGGLSTLMYSVSYIAAHSSVSTLCTDTNEAVGYTEFPMTVLVEVATVSSISGNVCPDIVSEEAANSRFVIPKCTNEVLFPPELTVSCIGSTFTTSWQNNELNIEVYNKDTEDYTVSRTWTYGNGTQSSTIVETMSGMDAITDLAAGTICTSTAAALPPNRAANKQECYDLDRVQFSEVVECAIIAIASIEFSEYTVTEGDGQATVCVVANGFGFTVSLQTNFTDTTDIDDFSAVLTFDNRDSNRICHSIPIKDDDIIEALTKRLSVVLNSSDPYLVISRGIAVISIVDDDFVAIGFEEDTYIVNEGAGKVTICATVEEGSRELGRDVIAELSVQNGTALDGEDFTSVAQTLIFNAATKTLCVEVEIVDNERLDSETKSFVVVLTSMDPAVNLSQNSISATVQIQDNDGGESFPAVAVTISLVVAMTIITAVLVVLLLLSYKTFRKKQRKTSDSGYIICDYTRARIEPDEDIVVPDEKPFMSRRGSENPEGIFYALKKEDDEGNEPKIVQEHSDVHPHSSSLEKYPETWVEEESASVHDAIPNKHLRRMGENSHSGISVQSEFSQGHGYVDMSASTDCSGGPCFVKHKLVATASLDSDTNTVQLQGGSDDLNRVLETAAESNNPALHQPALHVLSSEPSEDKQLSLRSPSNIGGGEYRGLETVL